MLLDRVNDRKAKQRISGNASRRRELLRSVVPHRSALLHAGGGTLVRGIVAARPEACLIPSPDSSHGDPQAAARVARGGRRRGAGRGRAATGAADHGGAAVDALHARPGARAARPGRGLLRPAPERLGELQDPHGRHGGGGGAPRGAAVRGGGGRRRGPGAADHGPGGAAAGLRRQPGVQARPAAGRLRGGFGRRAVACLHRGNARMQEAPTHPGQVVSTDHFMFHLFGACWLALECGLECRMDDIQWKTKRARLKFAY